jgi:hypothetical protein
MAIIFLLNLEIGYLTPPVGLNLFLSSLRFGKGMAELYRAVVPFIALLIATLLIVTCFPWLATWLPSRIKTEDEVRALSGGYMPGEVEQSGPREDTKGLLGLEDAGVDGGWGRR